MAATVAYAPMLGGAAAVAVLLLKVRRAGTRIPLRPERLWIAPAILAAVCTAVLVAAPPHAGQWPWLAGTTLLGAAAGWWRGGMTVIRIHSKTGALSEQASPAALVFLLLLLFFRYAARTLVFAEGRDWQMDTALVTDVFLVFAVALVAIQRLRLAWRVRALRAEISRDRR